MAAELLGGVVHSPTPSEGVGAQAAASSSHMGKGATAQASVGLIQMGFWVGHNRDSATTLFAGGLGRRFSLSVTREKEHPTVQF